MRLKIIFLVLRIVGVFIAASSLFGLIMFWSTIQLAAAGVPFALLLLSLVPASEIKNKPWLLVITAIFVILSYSVAGVPFLEIRDDFVARLLHLTEFLLICILALQAFVNSGRMSK